MKNIILKIDGRKIAELKPSTFSTMPSSSVSHNTDYLVEVTEKRTKEIDLIATSTALTLRLNPLSFETTNLYFEYHKEFFHHKAKEMINFYLLNPEE